MKRLEIPRKLVHEKFYTRNYRCKFIKNLLPKNAKKACKSNNRDLNRY